MRNLGPISVLRAAVKRGVVLRAAVKPVLQWALQCKTRSTSGGFTVLQLVLRRFYGSRGRFYGFTPLYWCKTVKPKSAQLICNTHEGGG